MAFFNKLNDLAKNIGDKTGDAIEMTKLVAKVTSEQKAKDEALKKIGEYFVGQFENGVIVPEELVEVYQEVVTHTQNIQNYQNEMEQIKAENEVKEEPKEEMTNQSNICPTCHKVNKPGTKYCENCGTKLEVAEPQVKTCPSCGTVVQEGTKFCSSCGQKVGE